MAPITRVIVVLVLMSIGTAWYAFHCAVREKKCARERDRALLLVGIHDSLFRDHDYDQAIRDMTTLNAIPGSAAAVRSAVGTFWYAITTASTTPSLSLAVTDAVDNLSLLDALARTLVRNGRPRTEVASERILWLLNRTIETTGTAHERALAKLLYTEHEYDCGTTTANALAEALDTMSTSVSLPLSYRVSALTRLKRLHALFQTRTSEMPEWPGRNLSLTESDLLYDEVCYLARRETTRPLELARAYLKRGLIKRKENRERLQAYLCDSDGRDSETTSEVCPR